jgi:hypothetical protein
VQADPGEAAALTDAEHGLMGRDTGLLLDPLPLAVDGAVDDRAGGGRVAGGVVGVVLAVSGAALAQGRADRCAQVTDHRHGGLLHGEAVGGAWRSPEWGRDVYVRKAGGTAGIAVTAFATDRQETQKT